METRRLWCQQCGSHETRNILVRERGERQTAYVRCGRCGDLVARHKRSGYPRRGKNLESYLPSQEMNIGERGSGVRVSCRIPEEMLSKAINVRWST